MLQIRSSFRDLYLTNKFLISTNFDIQLTEVNNNGKS